MISIDLQYFPPITYFSTLFGESYVELSIFENYRKMSFRNRCFLAGAEGVISLSIPLVNGRNQRIQFADVLVSNAEDWQKRHWKTIQSAYARSPFFEHYHDELKELFDRRVSHLAEWNLLCLNWVLEKLKWTGRIVTPDNRGNDLSSKYIETVLPKNYTIYSPVKYRQVFEERTGFLPNLSILDLLCNTGNDAARLLTKKD